MAIYEFINPSDDYSFEADSNEVAALVVCCVSSHYGAERDGWRFGPFILGGMHDAFREEFGVDGEASAAKNREALCRAFASFRIGDRDSYAGLDDGGIDALIDKRRTSMNSIGVQLRSEGLRLLKADAVGVK